MMKRARTLVIGASLLAASCVGTLPSSGSDPGGGGDDTNSDPGGSNSDPGGGSNGNGSGSNTGSNTPDPLDSNIDPLSAALGFKNGQDQHTALCARGLTDAVAKKFCATTTQPAIADLKALQQFVGLGFNGGNGNATGGNPGFALTGHSTSLVTHFTSAINPRVIIFTPPPSSGRVNNPTPLPSFTAIGFVRGEQFVELVSNDAANKLNFFLVRFTQACNATAAGCSLDDILTPKVESNFTGYSLYSEEDLKNTIFDCQQCHQPGGPTATKNLRMQELQNPWGHFFRNNRANGQVMLADFATAHAATETYGGIPGAAITNSDPAQLEGLVENQGFRTQPNEFNTNQLLDNGASAGWLTLYNNAKAGLDIPAPYHENRVTDPAKLSTAAAALKAAIAGTAPLTMDIRDIFPATALSDLQFRPSADLVTAQNGKAILVQMCQQCHNPNLDQTLSRARFDVTKLDTMSRAEKDKAIARINLQGEAARRMPPVRFRELSASEIQIVTTELQK